MWKVQAVAHPTIGIVLLGGLKDQVDRLPYHSSAGIAYSLMERESVARTTMEIGTERESVIINGTAIDSLDSRSPMKIIKKYEEMFRTKYGKGNVSIISDNENILSGSSDAGAAALGKCIEASIGVDPLELELEMRKVSESAGRSYYGGLTITYGGARPYTKKILDSRSFDDIVILSAVFPHKRKPSDDIHTNQPRHEYYKKRMENAEKAVKILEKLAYERNVKGIFELAMDDTEDYHYMNSLVGVQIVTPEMRKLMDKIREWRSEMWMTYIVTGGNSVFLPTMKENKDEIRRRLENYTGEIYELRVAEGARIISL